MREYERSQNPEIDGAEYLQGKNRRYAAVIEIKSNQINVTLPFDRCVERNACGLS